MRNAKIAITTAAFALTALVGSPALSQGNPVYADASSRELRTTSVPGTTKNAVYDDVGFKAIRAKDWATAEKQLVAGLEKNPDNVFRQLNLAWVYVQMGRKDEAAAIYHRIIMGDQDRTAQLASRQSQSVKVLAQRGLALIEMR
jgi:Tfp pilus assembly protein PilF